MNASRTASTAGKYSDESRNSRLVSASSTLAENFSGLLFCGWITVFGAQRVLLLGARVQVFVDADDHLAHQLTDAREHLLALASRRSSGRR